jgi:hypothetical protein
MSNASPPTDKAATTTPKLPPEEQFWQRYSPHHEAPLSWAGSFMLHVLVIGSLVLFGIYLASALFGSNRSLPVEPVRLALGGGGGKPSGVGGGKGIGHGPEDVGPASEEKLPGQDDNTPKRPALNPIEKKQISEKFDPASARYIQESNSDAARAYARMEEGLRKRLADGLQPGHGKGGPGSGGGKDRGKGTGEGAGTGPGKATLTQREKRMLRWHMRFTANTGPEYLAQLRGLGAILGIPVNEGGKTEFWIVRDLHPPAKLLKNEDLSKIQRIYWWDDKPESAADIMRALGGEAASLRPGRFVAFMPEKLEKELFEMERRYVVNVLRMKPFNEDKIDETNFRVVPTGRGYRPELISVTLRR